MLTDFLSFLFGTFYFLSTVSFDDVILPDGIKEGVLEIIQSYEKVKEAIVELEVDKSITYGTGQCILFYGASGTGKTMLANAIATKLKKKILLVHYPSLSKDGNLKVIFRECKIHNAILFFDECEQIFLSRKLGGGDLITTILTEIERHEGLCILSTNIVNMIDDAMFRRINLSIEFKHPDHLLREKIWRAIHPPKVTLHEDVNLSELALKYELSGGELLISWRCRGACCS